MVTQTNLADVLIEAGFEPSIALRATQLIEQDLSDLAKQTEMDFRFNAVDLRFDAVDRELKALNTRFDDLKDSVDRSLKDHKEASDRSLQDHKEANDRSLKDLKESIDRRLSILTWVVGLGFTAGFGIIVALLVELLNR